MEAQPVGAAPHHHVAMRERHALDRVAAREPAELEHRRHAQRHRNDRRAMVAFVAVLVQREPRAGLVAVDQAGIGPEAREARRLGRLAREPRERGGHRGPGLLRQRIDRVVAVAAAVADPAQWTAVRHRHRHGVAAGRHQVPERRHALDARQRGQQLARERQREAAQHAGTRAQRLGCAKRFVGGGEELEGHGGCGPRKYRKPAHRVRPVPDIRYRRCGLRRSRACPRAAPRSAHGPPP